jgi:putative addiction module component (TIGR02574 family)
MGLGEFEARYMRLWRESRDSGQLTALNALTENDAFDRIFTLMDCYCGDAALRGPYSLDDQQCMEELAGIAADIGLDNDARFSAIHKERSMIDIGILSRNEQLELFGRLWKSLSSIPNAVPLTDEQREELDRRLDQLENDGPDGIPAEDALIQLHANRV